MDNFSFDEVLLNLFKHMQNRISKESKIPTVPNL